MPEPFETEKLSWPPSRTLAERLDLIASLNETLAALDAIGVSVFMAVIWLDAYLFVKDTNASRPQLDQPALVHASGLQPKFQRDQPQR